jgi:HK97 gp10 family phage protein
LKTSIGFGKYLLRQQTMAIPKVRGVAGILKKFDKFGSDGTRLAVAITNQTAENITNKARARSPVDLGQLRQSIGNTEATTQLNRSLIFATAPYAPYQNWGTGGLVVVTPEFQALASQFKGRGLKKINIPATGFLTTPYSEEAKEYPKRLKKGFDKLTRDFNNKK